MSQRVLTKIYDQTSGSGATLTVTGLRVGAYDGLLIFFKAAGAAAPTSVSITKLDDSLTALDSVGVTVAIAGTSAASMGVAGTQAASTNGVYAGEHTNFLTITGTGGAASTVRILVYALNRAAS